MEANDKTYKKYVYIANEINPIIENVCKEKKIHLVCRYINDYNFENFLQTELPILNSIDYLIINYSAVSKMSNENDIVTTIEKIRRFCDLRIIFILEGATKGNTLLGRLFYLGIYNFITATNDTLFKEELIKTLSEKGMNFANSAKFQLDNNFFNISGNTKIVKEKYVKVKQKVTVGICSSERHIGATTQAINITKYLSQLPNVNVCYIENNRHNSIIQIYNMANKEDVNYYEETGKIEYQGIEMYMQSSISEIINDKYDFLIFDFGSMQDMNDSEVTNFLTKDIKFIVSGTKSWELPGLFECFEKIGNDRNINFIFNFTKNEDKQFFKNNMGDFKDNTMFSEYIEDSFVVANKLYWERIFNPFILNTNIKEIKKRKFSDIFKKGVKHNE